VPVRAVVAHHDPARDYQLGVQHARRPGSGVREVRLDLPAAIPAGEAKTLAATLLARAEGARMRRTVTLDLDDMGIGPGDTVRIAGEEGVWRVTEVAVEAMVVRLDLVPLVPASLPLSAASGRHVGAADRVAGATRLAVFETPALDDAVLAAPRLTVAAAGGPGWRSASLHYSLDDGASWVAGGMTAAPAVMGRIVALAPGGSAALVDDRADLVVHVEGRLHDADDAALDGGANLALLGDELIQFARATGAGGGRWRLEGLRRGLRGTEAAIGGQRPGDRFVLLEPGAARTIDLPVAALGRRVQVMAHGVGDGIEGVVATLMIAGASVRPPMPAGARQYRLADGRVAIGWIRRSRAGWRWLDGVDAPLGEEREAYRVSVDGTDVETVEPRLEIAAAPGAVVAIRQRGTLAESPPLMLTVMGRNGA
ncbi:phage tail protein, partial [uncultured Sphingomonas sp.]|uniref:GTA baseplate fiber-binding domain-containing protein n=1 Tax=uncultured Sphingomonas sp. TaxID=158754 RepID=UPI002614BD0D